MAPRRGLFRRILDRVIHPFGRAPEPSSPPEPPPKGILPPPPPQPPHNVHEQRMQDIFVDFTGALTGNNYLEWRELYDPMSVIFSSDDEIEDYWDEFLRAYFLVTSEAGHVQRKQFHRDTGIPESEVDWDLWRELRRGTP